MEPAAALEAVPDPVEAPNPATDPDAQPEEPISEARRKGGTPQTAMDERELDDAELARKLEKALEDRQVAKGKAAEARKKQETMSGVVDDLLEEAGLEDGDVLRVGRFRIAQTNRPAEIRNFEVPEGHRRSIKADPVE